jgi:OFA family oxalate/formate antiporter-like MFS transporter
MTGTGGRAWLTLGLMSALFFIITATTYASLGLALPAMVAELHWSWTEAGTGFGLLGLFNGITSAVPATLIRRFGVRAC